ncbi:hypothetical protein WA026_016231, partial [Henosepilachna vigintioctopunctata]
MVSDCAFPAPLMTVSVIYTLAQEGIAKNRTLIRAGTFHRGPHPMPYVAAFPALTGFCTRTKGKKDNTHMLNGAHPRSNV